MTTGRLLHVPQQRAVLERRPQRAPVHGCAAVLYARRPLPEPDDPGRRAAVQCVTFAALARRFPNSEANLCSAKFDKVRIFFLWASLMNGQKRQVEMAKIAKIDLRQLFTV
jgi:hypothetical protein